MFRRTLVVVALVLTAGYCGDTPSDDKAILQGIWAIQSVEVNGEVTPIVDGKMMKLPLDRFLVIQGDSYVFHYGREKVDFAYAMNPVTRPKQIDLKVISGPQMGQTYRCIYKLEADTYTFCCNIDPEQARPVAFGTSPYSGLMIVVWKRVKA
jgi:uncharacterized protein (TIGR03067 family)